MKPNRFILLRIKNASFRELVYRAQQRLMHKRIRRMYKKRTSLVPAPAYSISQVKNLVVPSFYSIAAQDTAEKIMHGERFTLNARLDEIEMFEESCAYIFSPDIAHSNPVIDIRQVWEPARLQHITVLLNWSAQNGNSLHDNNVAQFVKQCLLDWIERNSFLSGAHYMCSMECGLRIPVFFHALKLLDNLNVHEQDTILTAIYRHAWWIARNLSLYSSRGNHTICEAVGLIFAGALFENTQENHEWMNIGLSLLSDEVQLQIHDDGGPAEQSFVYHRFVLDLYWFTTDFLESNDIYDCSSWKKRLIKGEEFLACFEDDNAVMPSIGDSDNGHAVAPGISPRRPLVKLQNEQFNVFNNSGYTIIHTTNESILTFDHGPLGMPPLYNHGHADALSVTLSKNGIHLLVDPGTFRYNPVDEWRSYFKGTRAHNTVTVDGQDQAVQETGFIWSHPYKTNIVRASKIEKGFIAVASHSGYTRLKNPVVHQRSILVFFNNNFIIKDTFSGRGFHDYELNYHLHPDTILTREDRWWVIDGNGTEIFIQLLGEDDFNIIKGQKSPVLGWYSPSYGIKIESPVLSCVKRDLAHNVTFTTVICTERPREKINYREMAQCI